jgi:PIN domain nuclease of toxin-antitoxin system
MSVDLLIDTHALIWYALGDERWTQLAGPVLEDDASTVSISSISWSEIAIKRALGRLDMDIPRVRAATQRSGFLELDFTADHAESLALLPMHHRDPFDRMLIAQALAEEMAIATVDRAFAAYDGLQLHAS